MVRKAVFGALGVALLLLAAAAVALAWAHVGIRRARRPLPAIDAVRAALLPVPDGPVRVALINTASQSMPRSAVLEASRDPRRETPYVMSHPAFVLEWADGRLLLLDAGMTRHDAITFGRLVELLSGGQPIEPHLSVAESLGTAVSRIQGAIFTHLHADHVGGISEVCQKTKHSIDVFLTDMQAGQPNFTTRPGLRLLARAGCVRLRSLAPAPLVPVPGFPGVTILHAAGHTPGSVIVLAHVTGRDPRNYAFLGDVANHLDGILYDVPKPWAYRLVLIPEDGARLSELRRFARDLRQTADATLVVSHDQRNLEESGIPEWRSEEVLIPRPGS